ncbi:unnamed protein product [Ilex paraguariensis]|uniref:Uncharacterized protein n=1 Tax=Ilex paraguariensis TaxID=185542 RepID=A0ABC8TRJ0_9AQUA
MDQSALPPHVLIFPLPFQSPVNYMFKIAELLCLSGFHITILLTDYIYNRLQRHFTFHYRFQNYPWLNLETISDGLPADDSHFVARVLDSLRTITKKMFKEIGRTLGGSIALGLTRKIMKPLGYPKGAEEISRGMELSRSEMLIFGRLSSKTRRPLTCIIADGFLGFVCDVANEIGIPASTSPILPTDYIYNRLQRHSTFHYRFQNYPWLRLETISDGLPKDDPRSDARVLDSLRTITKKLFKEMLISGRLSSETCRPLTCIIAHGFLGFVCAVADEIGIPVIYSRTLSPCCLWVFFCLPKLIEADELFLEGVFD